MARRQRWPAASRRSNNQMPNASTLSAGRRRRMQVNCRRPSAAAFAAAAPRSTPRTRLTTIARRARSVRGYATMSCGSSLRCGTTAAVRRSRDTSIPSTTKVRVPLALHACRYMRTAVKVNYPVVAHQRETRPGPANAVHGADSRGKWWQAFRRPSIPPGC